MDEDVAQLVLEGCRFVVRGDYSLYTVFVGDTRSTEYRAFTAGLSFFF